MEHGNNPVSSHFLLVSLASLFILLFPLPFSKYVSFQLYVFFLLIFLFDFRNRCFIGYVGMPIGGGGYILGHSGDVKVQKQSEGCLMPGIQQRMFLFDPSRQPDTDIDQRITTKKDNHMLF